MTMNKFDDFDLYVSCEEYYNEDDDSTKYENFVDCIPFFEDLSFLEDKK